MPKEYHAMLADLKCSPIDKTVLPIPQPEAQKRLPEIPGWELRKSAITREFTFRNFVEAMLFVNKIADIANAEDHHPDIFISYNRVKVELSTHKIGGLSMNDFIVAAKINMI
jgi:4a-hydroxytetrahydrobiopterin dehydratase